MTTLLIRIRDLDQLALYALVVRRNRALDRLMETATRLGDPALIVGIVTSFILLAGPDLRMAGWQAALALAVSHGIVQVLKRTVARPRPHLPPGITTLVAAPDRFSFPSGHSAATMSVALPIAMALPTLFATVVMTMAVFAGLSRSYLGVHYPGDVLAGWLLAALSVLAAPLVLGGVPLL